MSSKIAKYSFHDFNALYVEDEEGIRKATQSILSDRFNELYVCENGLDGLEFYKNNKNKIDMVITDINMPKLNGIDMSKEIKKINKSVPILITSAHNESEYLLESINIGIDGYVLKPIDFMSLFEKILDVLEPKILKEKLKSQERESQERLLVNAKFAAIGQLTAGLTHEINTPLTYIKGSVEIMNKKLKALPESKTKDVLEKQFERVDDGVKRIINIVDSMTEMAAKSSESYEVTNIYETVIMAAIMAYNRSKHTTKIYVNDEMFSINMDKNRYCYNAVVQKQRIGQVWIIIINNALDELIKIKDFNERKLSIKIEETESIVKVIFEDNAGGIDSEIYDKLFEPFKSTKESSGMGVGLSIAKKIVDEQKGEISAYNKNDGAVFEIKLPK